MKVLDTTCLTNGRDQDMLETGDVEKGLATTLVGYDDELHRPFGWGEEGRAEGGIELFVVWDEFELSPFKPDESL